MTLHGQDATHLAEKYYKAKALYVGVNDRGNYDHVYWYIDRFGLKGLSKEEAELAKPFFSRLFIYFHDQAVQKDHSAVCTRKECDLRSNQPVFMTASQVLCVDCALQYVIGNCRDWYYYLGNFEAQAGAIPYDIQKQGTRIKEQITELRSKTKDPV